MCSNTNSCYENDMGACVLKACDKVIWTQKLVLKEWIKTLESWPRFNKTPKNENTNIDMYTDEAVINPQGKRQ